MLFASAGILAGVTFSSGMMEVARKGIFHPQFFTMPELMFIFLAVMLTDVILLDVYNTFGLPTSTTVSIVFGLIGAAVAVSLIKTIQAGQLLSDIVNYINTAKALAIISGILSSVVLAFLAGVIIQFFTRLVFSFDYLSRLKRYGGIWCGLSLAAMSYFILIKGAKGASFMTAANVLWIKEHTLFILAAIFLVSAVLLQVVITLFRANVLKFIILFGTFALAMAFSANDLVNFIGVPLAGLKAYQITLSSPDPLSVSMEPLMQPCRSNTFLLLLSGAIMVVTLWFSRKARTVSRTELSLSRQDEGFERFGSSLLSRLIVRMVCSLLGTMKHIIPSKWQAVVSRRLDPNRSEMHGAETERSSFDLIRASVNLMVASMLISFGTSLKLPLSTTYVTFMVAMGTSFSDRAWGRESAVYRVTGVLTVIGGWFFTAFTAFALSGIIAIVIFFWRIPAVALIVIGSAWIIINNHRLHRKREQDEHDMEVFNLKKIRDPHYAINTSFEHLGVFLTKVRENLEKSYQGLCSEDRVLLKAIKRESKRIQNWANIIIANIFKTLRLLSKQEVAHGQSYVHIIGCLQEIAESHRDIILRVFTHIDNNHTGMLQVQLHELEKVKNDLSSMLAATSHALLQKDTIDLRELNQAKDHMRQLVHKFDKNQILRIQDRSSKTRLSILFYGLVKDAQKIGAQLIEVAQIFNNILSLNTQD